MQTADLFDKTTKAERLEKWCAQKGFFTKIDLTQYGLDNFYISAWRRVDEFVQAGKVRRLSKEEAAFRGFRTKCAVYCYVGSEDKNGTDRLLL